MTCPLVIQRGPVSFHWAVNSTYVLSHIKPTLNTIKYSIFLKNLPEAALVALMVSLLGKELILLNTF